MNNTTESRQTLPKTTIFSEDTENTQDIQYRYMDTTERIPLDHWKPIDLLPKQNISYSEVHPPVYPSYLKSGAHDSSEVPLSLAQNMSNEVSRSSASNYSDINLYRYSEYNNNHSRIDEQHPHASTDHSRYIGDATSYSGYNYNRIHYNGNFNKGTNSANAAYTSANHYSNNLNPAHASGSNSNIKPTYNESQRDVSLQLNYSVMPNDTNYYIQPVATAHDKDKVTQHTFISSWNTEGDFYDSKQQYQRFSSPITKKRVSQQYDLSPASLKKHKLGSMKLPRPRRRKSTDPCFGLTDSAIPFFGDTSQANKLCNEEQSVNYGCKIVAKVDRGFFLSSNEWTCYRRNYFQINTCFNFFVYDDEFNQKLEAKQGEAPTIVINSDDKCAHKVKQFFVSISALIDNNATEKTEDLKKVELIMHTSKRDKGPQLFPTPRQIKPGGNLQAANIGNIEHSKNIVCFERVQFKTATANNGKRRAAQQYYKLVLDLVADCEDGLQIPVASVASAQLVVRGRSPGHYNDNPAYGSSTGTAKTPLSPRPALQNQVHIKSEESPQNHIRSIKDKYTYQNRKYDLYKSGDDKNLPLSQPNYTDFTLPSLNMSMDNTGHPYGNNQQLTSSLPPFHHNPSLNPSIHSFNNQVDSVGEILPISQNVNQMVSKVPSDSIKNNEYVSPMCNHNSNVACQFCQINQKTYNIDRLNDESAKNYNLLGSTVQGQNSFNNLSYFISSNPNIDNSSAQIQQFHKSRTDNVSVYSNDNLSEIENHFSSNKRRLSQLNTSNYQLGQTGGTDLYSPPANYHNRNDLQTNSYLDQKLNSNNPPLSAPEPAQAQVTNPGTEINQNNSNDFHSNQLYHQTYNNNPVEKHEAFPSYNYNQLPFYKYDIGQQESYDNILIGRYSDVSNNNILNINSEVSQSNDPAGYKNPVGKI